MKIQRRKPIVLGKRVSFDLLREVPAAMKSRFLKPFYKPSVAKTKSFFQKYRKSPGDVAITDFSTGHFSSAVHSELPNLIRSPFDVCIDLGCGNSSLSKSFENTKFWKQYMGVDIHIEENSSVSSNILFEHDLNSGLPVLGNFASYLFVAVNSFCYIEDIRAVIRDVEKLPGTKLLLIVDPQPSLLWENAFHGFSIFLRGAQEILSNVTVSNAEATIVPINLGIPLLRRWVASNFIQIHFPVF